MLILLPTACNNKQIYPYPHPMECGDGRDESKLCIPQEVKDYCYFKTGSYWVYIDSLTGTQDCVYVVSSKISFVDKRTTSDLNQRRIFEVFSLDFRHSNDQFRDSYYSEPNVWGFNSNVQFTVTGPGLIAGRQHFDYPYTEVTRTDPNNPNKKFMIRKLTSAVINSKSYSQVFYYRADGDGSMRRSSIDAAPNHTYYLARNVGLIKRTIRVVDTNNSQNTVNRVWLLSRYKIIQ